jgi:hypothetical protein
MLILFNRTRSHVIALLCRAQLDCVVPVLSALARGTSLCVLTAVACNHYTSAASCDHIVSCSAVFDHTANGVMCAAHALVLCRHYGIHQEKLQGHFTLRRQQQLLNCNVYWCCCCIAAHQVSSLQTHRVAVLPLLAQHCQ